MIVETKLGTVRGKENKCVTSGEKYYSFLGIPYAKPPIDELRFLPPVPAEKWHGVYDATRDRNPCIQAESIHSLKMMGSEDCLYLNVHTRELNPTSLKPVMFYIHPGGYVQGTGASTFRSADYLMEHDVVLVTINYRLHILGFLNLQIPECPGNVGLKDQLLALQWVKENISDFGGDSQNITVFGSSAGASSVNYLMISPQTKGLFQKAIIQSGTALSMWALVHEPVKLAFRIGRKIGYQGDDPRCLLKALKSLSSEDIVKLMLSFFRDLVSEYPMRCFPPFILPSVEQVKENAFIPDYPEKLFASAELRPCIIGHNSLEASIMWPIIPEPIRENPMEMFPNVIKNNFNVPESELSEISKKVKSFYFEDDDITEDKLQKMMRLLSDIFTYRFHESYQYLEQSKIPPYVYYFTYYDKEAYPDARGIKQRFDGAFHGEEEGYLFVQKYPPLPLKLEGDNLKVREYMCSLWTNFAKSGDPTRSIEVKWKPSTSDAPCYLQIDQDLKMIDGKIGEERLNFLSDAVSKAEVLKL